METHDTRTACDLTPFDFNGSRVRAMLIDGDPWFVAADAARLLRYRDAERATRLLDPDMRGTHNVGPDMSDAAGREMSIISEPGLYRLIMRSRRPEARQIERWVVTEVLPAIRRTGSYSVAAPTTDVSTLDRRALALMVIEAEDARAAAEAKVAELEPAAEAWGQMVAAGGDLSLTAAAKALQSSGAHIKARDFFLYLHEKRWTYRAGGVGDWLPYADVLDRGLMTTRLVNDHEGRTKPQARVTVLGMEKLRAMLIADRGTPGGRRQTSLELVVSR